MTEIEEVGGREGKERRATCKAREGAHANRADLEKNESLGKDHEFCGQIVRLNLEDSTSWTRTYGLWSLPHGMETRRWKHVDGLYLVEMGFVVAQICRAEKS